MGKFKDNNHYNKSNHDSNSRNITNHSKKLRRSKRKNKSNNIKILYANVRGFKSKLRDINMILFDTEPDIAAFVETNLKAQEKLAVCGYTWVGKNRQHKEGGGVGYFIKNTIKNSCTVEPDNNTTT